MGSAAVLGERPDLGRPVLDLLHIVLAQQLDGLGELQQVVRSLLAGRDHGCKEVLGEVDAVGVDAAFVHSVSPSSLRATATRRASSSVAPRSPL